MFVRGAWLITRPLCDWRSTCACPRRAAASNVGVGVRFAGVDAEGFTLTATWPEGWLGTRTAPAPTAPPIPPSTVPAVVVFVVVAPVPSVSLPAGMPIAELPAKVPEDVWPGEVPSAAFPLSFEKLVSRPNVAWLGTLGVLFRTVDEVVVVVVCAVGVPVAGVLPVAAVALAGALTRPCVLFVVVALSPEAEPEAVVPLVDVEQLLPPVPVQPPLTTADGVPVVVPPVVGVPVVPVIVVGLLIAPVAATVPLLVVPAVPAAGLVLVVVVVMLPLAASALPAVSESTTAAATWAGERVFMVTSPGDRSIAGSILAIAEGCPSL